MKMKQCRFCGEIFRTPCKFAKKCEKCIDENKIGIWKNHYKKGLITLSNRRKSKA